eukprot:TRINITY_DN1789_c0_g1_i2.p1 TRINITY_DN1789_c0_g1~~TRINITY_DN1789_c0_g1_i2.p1  ORF type:complete len:721 (-),score=156.02 TRINITY_DN1789_c0_g1_i2:133-2295(-)
MKDFKESLSFKSPRPMALALDNYKTGDKNALKTKADLAVYQAYQEVLQKENLRDFADMLVNCVALLKEKPWIVERMGIEYLLVDEFQDTKGIDFELVTLLAGTNRYVTAVGDDDQAIYSFRGASPKYFAEFLRQFNAHEIFLVENYRSTQQIIDTAVEVVRPISDRRPKTLVSTKAPNPSSGLRIRMNSCQTVHDEARWVADQVEFGLKQAYNVAILYRSVQKDERGMLQAELMTKGIKYRITAGTQLYKLVEIQDLSAMLRYCLNRNDSDAFRRVVAVMCTGIGDKSCDKVIAHARSKSAQISSGFSKLPAAKSTQLQVMETRFRELRKQIASSTPAEALDIILRSSKYIEAQTEVRKKGKQGKEIKAEHTVNTNINLLRLMARIFLCEEAREAGMVAPTAGDVQEELSLSYQALHDGGASQPPAAAAAPAAIAVKTETLAPFLCVKAEPVTTPIVPTGPITIDSDSDDDAPNDGDAAAAAAPDPTLSATQSSVASTTAVNVNEDELALQNRGLLALRQFSNQTVMEESSEPETDKGLQPNDNTDCKVIISTVHKAKGLEWDMVIVPCWTAETFPLNNDDERRVAHVALTRARTLLFISYSQTDKGSCRYLDSISTAANIYHTNSTATSLSFRRAMTARPSQYAAVVPLQYSRSAPTATAARVVKTEPRASVAAASVKRKAEAGSAEERVAKQPMLGFQKASQMEIQENTMIDRKHNNV